jgi:transposase
MTGSSSKLEVLDGPQRRRHWTAAEKLAIVQETYEPDVTVSLVARRHGVVSQSAVPLAQACCSRGAHRHQCSGGGGRYPKYRALQNQIRELQRLLGKKTLEAEILKEALEVATGPKMSAVCSVLEIARSTMAEQAAGNRQSAGAVLRCRTRTWLRRSRPSSAAC